MRLLIFYVNSFSFETHHKGLDSADDIEIKDKIENAILGFIHVEEKDETNSSDVETKLIKNLKWAARKNETNKIILHSFNHLSESSANPDFTKLILNNAELRLKNSDYETYQTPFGYFLNIQLDAPGKPLARIFKEF
ncbi:MAG: threonyl-tRNA synthetase editing domain-containing protein [Ignavibacteriae bacterium]|nr:threonyl-tRNA synthetase editing domain-containing protein [Ignavibacteriota bacterium]